METNIKNVRPFRPVHPGGILKGELDARGIRQKKFAAQIGVSPSYLNGIIKGKRGINECFANGLERELGIPARHWLKMQANYDYDSRLLELDEPRPVDNSEVVYTIGKSYHFVVYADIVAQM